MSARYIILGSGRQGTYAAYDLLKHGGAESVTLADVSAAIARSAAGRVNRLMGSNLAEPARVDVSKPSSVERLLKGNDVLISAVPYRFNLALARLAVKAKVSMVDLGGHTGIVRKQLALNETARRNGISIVPDCGMGPGANITLAVRAIQMLDRADQVRIYDGGLPANPKPPWNYSLLFNIGGLTNEYTGSATFLRGGKRVEVPALTELEHIYIEPFGKLEALVTTGGLSTMPWTYGRKLKVLENKTLRYPGHWSRMQAFSELGLFSEKPIEVGGKKVIPREVFQELFSPLVQDPRARDVAVIHVVAHGKRGGRDAKATVSLIDRYDEASGFRAMERLTGGHVAMTAAMIADGRAPLGVRPVEEAVPPRDFIEGAKARGMKVTEKV